MKIPTAAYLYASLFAALILGAGTTQAATITVLNHSFEGGTTGSGGSISKPPWVRSNGDGSSNAIPIQQLTPLGSQADAAPDGTDSAHYTNNNTTDNIYQVLTATLQANMVYTLTVDVGDRTNLVAQAGAIRLGYVSSSPTATNDYGLNLLTANVINDTVPVNGAGASDGWETWQSTFTTGATPAGEGQDLRIELVSFGGVQTLWDNVRLDGSAIPEPSAAILTVLGSLLLLRRRR